MLKLKSAIKKFPSLTKKSPGVVYLGRNIPATESTENDDGIGPHMEDDLRTVYVGKSRRRYFVSSKVVDHPLFREIADKSMITSGGIEKKGAVVVSCEVVLFEHLLWMLEGDGGGGCDQSLDELVEFYTCVN
ncbi:hypothetical protein MLD38_005180 [Melastoma candidum]|uniref:Uncharacterized protein n=1 Tax=Melastoma candidum TaxID=119954 RepID=A0ACB9S9Y9_9MYRT|nr:hypothetical protein MLD38_005180 [Melastoma candidum]